MTFLLGIMASVITDSNANVMDNGIVGCVIVLLIVGCLIDIVGKSSENSVEKLTVRILRNMTYERYRFLLDFEQKDEWTV